MNFNDLAGLLVKTQCAIQGLVLEKRSKIPGNDLQGQSKMCTSFCFIPMTLAVPEILQGWFLMVFKNFQLNTGCAKYNGVCFIPQLLPCRDVFKKSKNIYQKKTIYLTQQLVKQMEKPHVGLWRLWFRSVIVTIASLRSQQKDITPFCLRKIPNESSYL